VNPCLLVFFHIPAREGDPSNHALIVRVLGKHGFIDPGGENDMPWSDKARAAAMAGRRKYCEQRRYDKTHCENGHLIPYRHQHCEGHKQGCRAARIFKKPMTFRQLWRDGP